MLPRLSTSLIVGLASGALISGCGGGSESTAARTVTSSSAPTSTAAAPTRTTILPPTATLPATAPASPAPAHSATTKTPLPTTAPSTTGTTGTKTVPRAVPQPVNRVSGRQAVAVCKGAVSAQPTLSSSAKKRLEKSCEQAAQGGQSALQRVAHEVCLEIINTAKVPAGAARERARATCSED
jgi:hypothetical protein